MHLISFFACTCSFEERDLCPKFSHLSLWLRVYPIGKESHSIEDWPVFIVEIYLLNVSILSLWWLYKDSVVSFIPCLADRYLYESICILGKTKNFCGALLFWLRNNMGNIKQGILYWYWVEVLVFELELLYDKQDFKLCWPLLELCWIKSLSFSNSSF